MIISLATEEGRRFQAEGRLRYLERERNAHGWLKHIDWEGARFHVLSWSLDWKGRARTHCSEPECEINHDSACSQQGKAA